MGTVITYALIGNRGRRRQPPDVAIVVASHAFRKPLQLRAPGSGLTNDLLQVFESSLGRSPSCIASERCISRDGPGRARRERLAQCLAVVTNSPWATLSRARDSDQKRWPKRQPQ